MIVHSKTEKKINGPWSIVHSKTEKKINGPWSRETKLAFKFENLEVWQKAIKLTYAVHSLTKKFPKEEQFILTSQIKRAADSIALNIAEGSTGQTNNEFKLFTNYAIRSAIEVISCLYIGKERNIIKQDDFEKLYSDLTVLVKMLQSLRNVLKT